MLRPEPETEEPRKCQGPRDEGVSLDPADWAAYRAQAHRALDEALDFIENVRDRPVWQPVPERVRENLSCPLPREGSPVETVRQELEQFILPHATGNIHPRFFGWVHGCGQPGGVVAEMYAAAMNSNCGGRDHGAIYVERQVISWCKELFGFPEKSSGLLLSGTSMANLVALGVARHGADGAARKQGVTSGLVAYTSTEAHESISKAMEILGIGRANLRKIPVRCDFTMNVESLRDSIAKDRAAGKVPFCVVGSAGTVNTGAIDDLEALARLCAEERLWFHVDGAFGSLCAMSDTLRPRLRGIDLADSIGFDFHKWAHVQYDAGCVLVRDGKLHSDAYRSRPAYLHGLSRGLGAGSEWPCDLGPELSRGFRALKVWFALKEHGVAKLGRLIERNCEQAQYLAAEIQKQPQMELLAPVPLNIVCFRVVHPGLGESELNALNQALVEDVQESGLAAPSSTTIAGKLGFRANITNHRTRFGDLDILVQAVVSAANKRADRGAGVSPA